MPTNTITLARMSRQSAGWWAEEVRRCADAEDGEGNSYLGERAGNYDV